MSSSATGENILKRPRKARYRGFGMTLTVTSPGDGTLVFDFEKDR